MIHTVELWPNGYAEGLGLTPSAGGSYDGWACLDDLSESDYVYDATTGLYTYSYYSLKDISIPSNAIITNLRLDTRGYATTDVSSYGYVEVAFKIGSSYYRSSWLNLPKGVKTDVYNDWATNPNTGVAWTPSDINGMYVGMYLRSDNGGQVWAYWLRCTVTYNIPGSPRAQIIGLW